MGIRVTFLDGKTRMFKDATYAAWWNSYDTIYITKVSEQETTEHTTKLFSRKVNTKTSKERTEKTLATLRCSLVKMTEVV